MVALAAALDPQILQGLSGLINESHKTCGRKRV